MWSNRFRNCSLYLTSFDCAATHEEYLIRTGLTDVHGRMFQQSLPEFNTGILAFKRCERMTRLLKDWGSFIRLYLKASNQTSR